MSLKKRLMPHLTKVISSDGMLHLKRRLWEIRRRLKGQPHSMEVFLSVSDPYSYLLSQILPELRVRFNTDVILRIVRDKQRDMFPDQAKWQTNAICDAERLAILYDLDFPTSTANIATPECIKNYTLALLAASQQTPCIEACRALFHQFWSGQQEVDIPSSSVELENLLSENQRRLKALGHYFSAMIFYAGEWYWGLDRLLHLEERLNQQELNTGTEEVRFNRQWQIISSNHVSHCEMNTPLTMYYSARSPYSYLGLEQVVRLTQKHSCPLVVKPVLPMMMRGMQVPQNKKKYIFHDTKRQAQLLGIPYGCVADPLGKAVENCYALFEFAQQQGKGIRFLLEFGRAVNSQGILADNHKGMKLIVERSDLDWQQAKPLLENQQWRHWADENMQALSELGMWGVPCFEFAGTVTWGQDRLWLIEREILKHKEQTPVAAPTSLI